MFHKVFFLFFKQWFFFLYLAPHEDKWNTGLMRGSATMSTGSRKHCSVPTIYLVKTQLSLSHFFPFYFIISSTISVFFIQMCFWFHNTISSYVLHLYLIPAPTTTSDSSLSLFHSRPSVLNYLSLFLLHTPYFLYISLGFLLLIHLDICASSWALKNCSMEPVRNFPFTCESRTKAFGRLL